MKKTLRLIILPACMLTGIVNISKAQTRFWVDNFEGAPSGGTRTPEENGGVGDPPNTSYFRLTDGSTVSQVVAFTGNDGSDYWAGEDHNAAGTGFTAGIDLCTKEIFIQELHYIHNNPINYPWNPAQHPEEYKYSSAKLYETGIDEIRLLTQYKD